MVEQLNSAAFGASVGFGTRPAVLVIDIVKAYTDPASDLYAGVEEPVASAVRVVDVAREHGVPVIFTTVVFTPENRASNMYYKKVPALRFFDEGNPLGEFVDTLKPLESETVITKQAASAFFNTTLLAELTALGSDTVIIVGLSTSGCVRATTVDAIQHDFRPIVVADAVGDRDPETHAQSLFDLGAKYADVIGETETLAWLRTFSSSTAATSTAASSTAE